ncbi:MAG: hypothetical protein JSV02_05850 [Dehalococcoidia bacterium]|nr:MAG: hypothetical protein JSV02_05850 [Dehalococcoidia bacterium]
MPRYVGLSASSLLNVASLAETKGGLFKIMVISSNISNICMDVDMDINVNMKDVCRYLGYSPDVEPSPRIASLLGEYIETARSLIRPAYSYIIKDIKAIVGSRAFIEGPVIFESEAIARLLERCEKVAVFILTVGGRLDETVRWLADSEQIIEAYVLDAIGSSVAEGLANSVEGRIQEAARAQGLCISRRFCPGYCDWDISQQEMVFSTINIEYTGVFLTDEYLMLPEKSMSGIIGIGSCDSDIESYSPCATCDKRGCPGRR